MKILTETHVLTRKAMLSATVLVILVLCQHGLFGQSFGLFGNKPNLDLIQKGAFFIYNQQPDSAEKVIAKVRKIFPNHPVVPMMEALKISYGVMPMKSYLPEYEPHIALLNQTIEKAALLRQQDKNHPEGVFFELAARGLIAEYAAEEGNHFKALNEGKKMYGLLKISLEMCDQYPEFYFTSGLYNYFREKFPQENAIYRPFVWIFKSGDIALGLKQLDLANEKAILAKVTSLLYTSYIYLHYEQNPERGISYLSKLHRQFPQNEFFASKLAELYIRFGKYELARPLLTNLLNSIAPHYRIAGETLQGIVHERHTNDINKAAKYYNMALTTSRYTKGGNDYKTMALLGLGRIDMSKGNLEAARSTFNEVVRIAESPRHAEEAKNYLKLL